MQLDRRQLSPCPACTWHSWASFPLSPARMKMKITKKVEAFRAAQAAGNADGIGPLCAEELSYSHSSGAIDDKAKLLAGVKNANYKWTTLEYKNPTVQVVGRPPSCASTSSASRNLPTARRRRKTSPS